MYREVSQYHARHALTVIAICLTAGCGSLSQKVSEGYGVGPITDIKTDEIEVMLEKVSAKMFTDDANRGIFKACSVGKTSYNNGIILSECQGMRNNFLATVVLASDQACSTHLKSMYGNEAGWNMGLASLDALFSTSAAAVGSVAAKTNYAATSAFFIGERALTNEVVYKNQLVPVIHAKITERRSLAYKNMRDRFAEDMQHYPFRVAVIDVSNYHYMCSFMHGLQWALQEGSASAQLLVARNNLRQAQLDLAEAQKNYSGNGGDAAKKMAAEVIGAATTRVTSLTKLVTQLEGGSTSSAADKPPADKPPVAKPDTGKPVAGKSAAVTQ